MNAVRQQRPAVGANLYCHSIVLFLYSRVSSLGWILLERYDCTSPARCTLQRLLYVDEIAFKEMLLNNWYLKRFQWKIFFDGDIDEIKMMKEELQPCKRFKSLTEVIADVYHPATLPLLIDLLISSVDTYQTLDPAEIAGHNIWIRRQVEEEKQALLNGIYELIHHYSDIVGTLVMSGNQQR